MFADLMDIVNADVIPLIYRLIFMSMPIVVPIILVYIFGIVWVYYIQLKFIIASKPFLYEIKIPKDIQKSPLAMEIILNSMQSGGAGNYTEAFIQGKVGSWFSLEIASTEGEIRFFIWASDKKFKEILMSYIYSQYPTVEVIPVDLNDDYTRQLAGDDTKKYDKFGVQYCLSKPDVYPIKTYVDYGLDKDQKDEYRIDPISSVLEFMATAGKGQHMWLQILIKKHGKEGVFEHRLRKTEDWKELGKNEVEKIRAEATPKTDGDYPGFPNPTKGQIEKIAAIERSIAKMAYYTMIRGIYIAENEKFSSSHVTGLRAIFKHYGSEDLNILKPKFQTGIPDEKKDWITIFPFLNIIWKNRITDWKKDMFRAYRLRSFFFAPYRHYKGEPFTMSVEELATLYHFPGNVTSTPTLNKIKSKRHEAPMNLPIKK